MLYYHLGHGVGEVKVAKGWDRGDNLRSQDCASRKAWLEWEQRIFKEIGERYGEDLDGYFVDDGCCWYPSDFEELGAALKAGNPNRVICINPADCASLTPFQDFYAGEGVKGVGTHGPNTKMIDGVLQAGPQRGLQFWGCFRFDGPWGINRPNTPIGNPDRWSVDQIVELTGRLEKHRCSVAINLSIYEDGTLSPASYRMLSDAAKRMKRGAWAEAE